MERIAVLEFLATNFEHCMSYLDSVVPALVGKSQKLSTEEHELVCFHTILNDPICSKLLQLGSLFASLTVWPFFVCASTAKNSQEGADLVKDLVSVLADYSMLPQTLLRRLESPLSQWTACIPELMYMDKHFQRISKRAQRAVQRMDQMEVIRRELHDAVALSRQFDILGAVRQISRSLELKIRDLNGDLLPGGKFHGHELLKFLSAHNISMERHFGLYKASKDRKRAATHGTIADNLRVAAAGRDYSVPTGTPEASASREKRDRKLQAVQQAAGDIEANRLGRSVEVRRNEVETLDSRKETRLLHQSLALERKKEADLLEAAKKQDRERDRAECEAADCELGPGIDATVKQLKLKLRKAIRFYRVHLGIKRSDMRAITNADTPHLMAELACDRAERVRLRQIQFDADSHAACASGSASARLTRAAKRSADLAADTSVASLRARGVKESARERKRARQDNVVQQLRAL